MRGTTEPVPAAWSFGITQWAGSAWRFGAALGGIATAAAVVGLHTTPGFFHVLSAPPVLGMLALALYCVVVGAMQGVVRVDGRARRVRVWPMGVAWLPTRSATFEDFHTISEAITPVKVRRGRSYTVYALRLDRVKGGHLVVARGLDARRHATDLLLLQRLTGLSSAAGQPPTVSAEAELAAEVDRAVSVARRTAWMLLPLWGLGLLAGWYTVALPPRPLLLWMEGIDPVSWTLFAAPVLAMVVGPRSLPWTLRALHDLDGWHRLAPTRPAMPFPTALFAVTLAGALLLLDVSWGVVAHPPMVGPGPLTGMYARPLDAVRGAVP